MKGHPFLVFFGFTHCPDICPTTLFDISQMMQALGPDADRTGALFITVDPERDTPAVLKDYLSNFDPHLRGLTGDQAAVNAAIKAYRVYAKKVPLENGDYTMDHTAIVYLMDKDGRFVAPFNMQPHARGGSRRSAPLSVRRTWRASGLAAPRLFDISMICIGAMARCGADPLNRGTTVSAPTTHVFGADFPGRRSCVCSDDFGCGGRGASSGHARGSSQPVLGLFPALRIVQETETAHAMRPTTATTSAAASGPAPRHAPRARGAANQ